MQAMGRSAPREAMQHLEALLEALPSLPEGPERDQAELVAQMTLGPALVAIRGFASPELEAAYTRAHQLCLALDRPYEETLVLHGLAAVNEFRGRYHRSEALLTQILHLGVSELAVEAYELLACSTFHQGAAARAVGYAERGLPSPTRAPTSPTWPRSGSTRPSPATAWAALALWFLGRPDSSLDHGEQARALAVAHPYSLASAEVQLAYLHQYRGEASETLRWAGRAMATASEHGFPIRVAQATIFGGWALAVTGGDGAGVEQLRAGLAGYLATGAELDHPYYLGLLAEGLAATAGRAEGLVVVEEAIRMVGTERPFYYLPELHRIRGDLLARAGQADQAAEAYGQAMELAAGHGSQVGRAAGGPAPLPPARRHPAARPTAPACGGSTTSSRRGSAPPTCWPPRRCWRAASPGPIERAGHAREIQRVDQQPRVADLAAAVGADEAPKLLLAGPSSPGRLPLERAERSQLALGLDDLLHSGGAEAADQLVLQVGDAHVEPECLHLGATEVGTEAGPLQTAPEVALLAGVTQARQSEVQPPRTEQLQEAPDVPGTAHRHHGNALSGKSRPRRAASASSATWSLLPSTSTTVRGSTPPASVSTLSTGGGRDPVDTPATRGGRRPRRRRRQRPALPGRAAGVMPAGSCAPARCIPAPLQQCPAR